MVKSLSIMWKETTRPSFRLPLLRRSSVSLSGAAKAGIGTAASTFSPEKSSAVSAEAGTAQRSGTPTDKYRQVIWQCNHKFDNDERCTTPHFTDDEIKAYFVSAVNKLLPEKGRIIKAFDTIKSTVFDTSDLDAEKTALEQEMVVVSEMMQQSIYENARVALDQTEYQKHYDGLTERFGKAKARLEEVTAVISDKANRQATIEDFLRELQLLDGMITEFDPMLWVSLVNFVTVYSKDDVRVTFKDGTEIRA
jgi:site-specific DNA recombinase